MVDEHSSIETDYEPRYVTLSDVPISGPGADDTKHDEFTDREKRLAIFDAETTLELDINGGDRIASDNVRRPHRAAVMNYATYNLVGSAEDPSSVTIGDMADGGGTITDHASQYLDRYEKYVDKIVSSNISGSNNSTNYSVSNTTE